MKQTRRNLLQAATIICTISIVFTMVWKPVAEAQRETKSDRAKELNGKSDIENPIASDVSELDISHLGLPDSFVGDEQPGRQVEVGTSLGEEEEPNGTAGTATPLSANEGRIEGYISPDGDVDFYSFTATSAGRFYVSTQTVSSAADGGPDSVMDVIGTDGTTVLENDDDDGSFGSTGSSIAGVIFPSPGTYYIRVRHFSATTQIRPYDLYFAFRNAAPLVGTEPNNDPGSAQPLGSASEVNGAITPLSDADFYSMTLNAGDSVFLSLDIDPERDNVQWNGRLGFGLFGSGTPNQVLVSNDLTTGSALNPLSENFFFTVKDAGTYYIYVDEGSNPTLVGGTYRVSATVFPYDSNSDCTTYASTDVPQAIPAGPGLTSSVINIPPGSGRINSAEVYLNLTHTRMLDLDVNLVSPRGNDNGLFTDIGAGTVGGTQTGMNMWIDDDAAVPPFFALTEDYRSQPEPAYRMEYFNGEDPTGTWRLDIRDDLANEGGTLNGWSLRICEEADPLPGTVAVFETNFESNDGGFTHSGTLDEWEYGTPNTVATSTVNPVASFLDCGSGTKCWKTDLDNTYEAGSSQNLDSPAIAIPPGSTDVELSWMMRYQIENADFDHAWIEIRPVGNPAGNTIIGQWDGATMANSVGNPAVNIGQSAGWGRYTADITNFAGQSVVVRFHLDSDASNNFGGLAIDDVKVTRVVSTLPTIVSGRLETPAGRGIANGRVVLTEQNGTKHFAISSTFGYFQFDSVLSQQNVTVTASKKQYTFNPAAFPLTGNIHTVMTGTPVP